MTGASLKYLIKEGFRNTWTNRMMSIAYELPCSYRLGIYDIP